MEKRILTVLRSGGDFHPRHVQALARQIEHWAPNARFTCLSDVPVPGVECLPLQYDRPGWWCKLEAFRPGIRGDFLLTDLDNVFLGPLDDILSVSKYTTQLGESNALAYYPEAVRAMIWEEWIRDPQEHMNYWDPLKTPVRNQFGDGGFIKSLMHAKQHWETLFPGQVTNIVEFLPALRACSAPWSMKRWPMLLTDIPKNTRVFLCYRPWRPWTLPVFKLMKLYNEEKLIGTA